MGQEKESGRLLLEEWILSIALAIMFVITIVNVFCRYVINYSIAVTEELAVYSFVATSIIGVSAACVRGANMSMEALVKYFPPGLKIASVWFAAALSCLLFGILVVNGAEVVLSQYKYAQQTPMLGIPMWIFSVALPLGGVFYIFRCIQCAIRETRALKKVRALPGREDRV